MKTIKNQPINKNLGVVARQVNRDRKSLEINLLDLLAYWAKVDRKAVTAMLKSQHKHTAELALAKAKGLELNAEVTEAVKGLAALGFVPSNMSTEYLRESLQDTPYYNGVAFFVAKTCKATKEVTYTEVTSWTPLKTARMLRVAFVCANDK